MARSKRQCPKRHVPTFIYVPEPRTHGVMYIEGDALKMKMGRGSHWVELQPKPRYKRKGE